MGAEVLQLVAVIISAASSAGAGAVLAVRAWARQYDAKLEAVNGHVERVHGDVDRAHARIDHHLASVRQGI